MAKKKPKLNSIAALKEVDKLIRNFEKLLKVPSSHPAYRLVPGKLYELYALSRTLDELNKRGWQISFRGKQIQLKGSPGGINPGDPYFALKRNTSSPIEYKVYTDIEVKTLGVQVGPTFPGGAVVSDLSSYHEIDIVVVSESSTGRPASNHLAMGVECKGTAQFSKAFVREVLGRRRELSFLSHSAHPPLDLQTNIMVNADPPSEYWLVFIDPAGNNYRQSPSIFGIEFKHWKP
jgi:hypothetical protein